MNTDEYIQVRKTRFGWEARYAFLRVPLFSADLEGTFTHKTIWRPTFSWVLRKARSRVEYRQRYWRRYRGLDEYKWLSVEEVKEK